MEWSIGVNCQGLPNCFVVGAENVTRLQARHSNFRWSSGTGDEKHKDLRNPEQTMNEPNNRVGNSQVVFRASQGGALARFVVV